MYFLGKKGWVGGWRKREKRDFLSKMTSQKEKDVDFVTRCYRRFEKIKSGNDNTWRLNTTEPNSCWIPIHVKTGLPATRNNGSIMQMRIYRAAYIAHIFETKGVDSAVRTHNAKQRKKGTVHKPKKYVKHECTNNNCANPDHLSLGDPKPPPKRSKNPLPLL